MNRTFRHASLGVAIAAFAGFFQSGPAGAQTDGSLPAKGPRIVAPQLIAPPEVAPSELQRIEPRPPLGGTLGAQPGDGSGPGAKQRSPGRKLLKADPLLFKPVVDQAGVIFAEGRTITLAGITPMPVEEICGEDAGAPWPCGMAARTAFRGFLRGRAVRCEFPDGDVPENVTVACRMGNRDLGEWLAGNGWARASDDTYKDKAKAAEEARRGMFGDAPRELAASLRAAPAPSAGAAVLPSGTVSILPSGLDPETGDGVDVIAPPVAPQSAGPSGIQSAPLPPPSAPQVE